MLDQNEGFQSHTRVHVISLWFRIRQSEYTVAVITLYNETGFRIGKDDKKILLSKARICLCYYTKAQQSILIRLTFDLQRISIDAFFCEFESLIPFNSILRCLMAD